MLFPIEFSQSIVRYYLIEFLYVKITFYVAGMLQDGLKKCSYNIFISSMFTCFLGGVNDTLAETLEEKLISGRLIFR